MPNIDYSESLFRSIDTIVAERVKNLPYDYTQLVEIVDDTNAKAGMYKISSDHQFSEIAYSDNPTYEKGDKVYVLNSADNKQRRFIIGLYQRNTNGRTDRVISILDGQLSSLKQSLTGKFIAELDELNGEIDGIKVEFGRTADGLLSIVEAKEEGLATMIRQTAEEIRFEAENTYEGLNASLSITAERIQSEVHDLTSGLESKITQTAGKIESEVHDYYNELESRITQTAGQIRSEVHDYQNGLESSITQTADKIEANVVDLKNEMETLISQTAYEIRSEAYDIQNGLQSEISQTAEEINFKVENVNQSLSIVSQTADQISSKVEGIEGNYSEIKQTADSISFDLYNDDGEYNKLKGTINGWEFLSSDTDGTTIINGDYIRTGTINAKSVAINYLNEDEKGGGFGLGVGSTSNKHLTYGAMVYGYEENLQTKIDWFSNITFDDNGNPHYNGNTEVLTQTDIDRHLPNNHIIATDAGVRMTSGTSSFYISGGTASLLGHNIQIGDDGSSWTTSDRNKKNSISYDMSKYESFFDALKPSSYKFNTGTSNRLHTGYIYQDVEQALLRSNLTSQDFAGLVKTHDSTGEINCGLRYEEFIPLNTYMIQKTRKELEEKDNKIQQLENKIGELEQKLNLLLETLS